MAILLNKLIAALHRANFFSAKEGGLLLQGTMGYYLWSKPHNKPFFHTRSKQKAFLAIVGRQKSSPQALCSKGRPELEPGPPDPLFQEAARLGNPY